MVFQMRYNYAHPFLKNQNDFGRLRFEEWEAIICTHNEKEIIFPNPPDPNNPIGE